MPTIKIDGADRYPRPYWPQILKEAGFVGELDIIATPYAAIVVHPQASAEQVRESLQRVVADLDERLCKAKTERFIVSTQQFEGAPAPSVMAKPASALITCPYPDCHGTIDWPTNLSWGLCPHCKRGIQVR